MENCLFLRPGCNSKLILQAFSEQGLDDLHFSIYNKYFKSNVNDLLGREQFMKVQNTFEDGEPSTITLIKNLKNTQKTTTARKMFDVSEYFINLLCSLPKLKQTSEISELV
jgi:hypothetical protein